MEKYVDGFLVPLAKDKIEDYRKLAAAAGAVWMDHGALEYVECVGDDLTSEHTATFPPMAGCAEGETVVFSYIVYESREHRDRVNEAVMKDPRLEEMIKDIEHPFDPKRMAYGGFRAIVVG